MGWAGWRAGWRHPCRQLCQPQAVHHSAIMNSVVHNFFPPFSTIATADVSCRTITRTPLQLSGRLPLPSLVCPGLPWHAGTLTPAHPCTARCRASFPIQIDVTGQLGVDLRHRNLRHAER